MPAGRRNVAAGNRYSFMAYLDEHGFMRGTLPSDPASGADGSGMNRIIGIKSATPAIPEPEVVPVTGDDILLAEFQFDSIATRRFNVDVAISDIDVTTTLGGVNVLTWGEILVGANDIVDAPEYDTFWLFQSRAKKYDAATKGKAAYNGILVPLASAQALGRIAFEERAAAAFRYSVSPQIAAYNPQGTTIQTSVDSTNGLRYRELESEYPVTFHRWTGDGILTTFNLAFAPISATKIAVYVNRVLVSVASVSAANKTVTLNAAPPSGSKVVAVYEFTE